MGGLTRAARLSPEERSSISSTGGSARATRLTKLQRREIARQAARARWARQPIVSSEN